MGSKFEIEAEATGLDFRKIIEDLCEKIGLD